MRRTSLVVLLALCAGALVAPAGAQTATCNGEPATASGSLVYGSAGADVIVGTEGDDRIYSEDGADTICGLGGDDTIDPGPGDDLVDGGGGSDSILFSLPDAPATTVDLAAGTSTGGEGSDELIGGSIENVFMNCSGGQADTLIGDGDDNTLSGGGGDDVLSGGAGSDLIYGTDPSVDRTDAICWGFDVHDDDVIDGGEGDDVLLGQEMADELDGGPGWDVIDGGDESDFCTRGERYARCERVQTLVPPAQCSDGRDNDGDGDTDTSDSGCSHPDDPREDLIDDPRCNDGHDNDGDDAVDFPEDPGCVELEDDTELDDCLGPCPPGHITIEFKPTRKVFRGELHHRIGGCETGRLVLLRRKRSDADRTIGRDRSNARAAWRVAKRRSPRGRFYAVARRTQVTLSGGETAQCPRLRSPLLRIQD